MGIQKHNGSSLVEVMVGLFVFAIGLLGILALQAKSIQFNQSAYSYSKAVYLANSMAEQIQLNPGQIDVYVEAFDPADAAPTACTGTDACDFGELAQWETSEWHKRIADTLPQGKATVEKSADENYALITIAFDDSRADGRVQGEVTGTDGEGADTTYDGVKEYKLLVGL